MTSVSESIPELDTEQISFHAVLHPHVPYTSGLNVCPRKRDNRFFRNAGNAAALRDFALNKTASHVITSLKTCQLVSYL